MPRRVTPRNLILDLLRVAPEAAPAPIAAFIDIGDTFGFSASSVRVALSRLVADGLVDHDVRGWYRASPATDPLSRHVENWRLGDGRMREFDGGWIAVPCGPWDSRTDQRRTERALRYLGFRPAIAKLWLRPDNLVAPRDEILARAEALGATRLDASFTARDLDDALVRRWCRELWDVRALEAGYRASLRALQRSLQRLPALPLDRALVDTFVAGGEAIRVLALDPLLPDALVDGDPRRLLHATMLQYDRIGRRRWHERMAQDRLARREVVQ